MRLSAHEVAGFVAARHGLTMRDMRNHSRSPEYARPRQIAMYAIRQLCPHLSLPVIARVLERKDHTTILHGVRRIEALIKTHPRVCREVQAALLHFRDSEDALDGQIRDAAGHLGDLIIARRQAPKGRVAA
jgi:chromosomal replication initiation ATPase DnaA